MTPDSKQYFCEDCYCCSEHVPGTYCGPAGAKPDGMCKTKSAPHPLMHDYLDVAKSSTIYAVILAFAIALPIRLSMHYFKQRE